MNKIQAIINEMIVGLEQEPHTDYNRGAIDSLLTLESNIKEQLTPGRPKGKGSPHPFVQHLLDMTPGESTIVEREDKYLTSLLVKYDKKFSTSRVLVVDRKNLLTTEATRITAI